MPSDMEGACRSTTEPIPTTRVPRTVTATRCVSGGFCLASVISEGPSSACKSIGSPMSTTQPSRTVTVTRNSTGSRLLPRRGESRKFCASSPRLRNMNNWRNRASSAHSRLRDLVSSSSHLRAARPRPDRFLPPPPPDRYRPEACFQRAGNQTNIKQIIQRRSDCRR